MKVIVALDGYEMKRLFKNNTVKMAKLFAQNIIDRYCSGEYLCEDELIEDELTETKRNLKERRN